jgi:hypothetical protein
VTPVSKIPINPELEGPYHFYRYEVSKSQLSYPLFNLYMKDIEEPGYRICLYVKDIFYCLIKPTKTEMKDLDEIVKLLKRNNHII